MHAAYKTSVQAAKSWLALLGEHRKAAACGFLLGGGLWLTLGTLWTKSYHGSAVIAFNPQSSAERDIGTNQSAIVAGLLAKATPQQNWEGFVSRFQLYPEIVAENGSAQAAKYLVSQVAIEEMQAPELGGEAVRIGYSGTDRNTVLGVTDAVAAGFTSVAPTKGDLAQAQSKDEPLYAPVTLPTAPTLPATPVPDTTISQGGRSAAALSTRLNASLQQGLRLQVALDQNVLVLSGLRRQQELAAVSAAPTLKTLVTVDRKAGAEEERLRQDLARAQRTLADLRQRYTEEYPDVVAAKERAQDLQLDLSRIVSLAATQARAQAAPQPEKKAATADPAIVAGQIAQADAAQIQLKQDIDQNRAATAQIQMQVTALAHGNPAAAATGPGLSPSALGVVSSQGALGSASGADDTSVVPSIDSTSGVASTERTTSAAIRVSPFFLVREASVTTSPWIFAAQYLWPLALFIGVFAASFAAWLAERRDPLIRNEGMLRHELPASAVFLGGVPRIRHEVIVD